ncbi:MULTISPECIES: M56 family metallopeptidase [unclassified Leptolyngbya]|uniref:M56 family metallopeptidase n=1 Tax=unclassified Leptolyngbya TaxID=2650499 RepID=UPI001689CE9A|nr:MULTISPECIES: M56 family metallopeptidase [unclassified Leptolyngbya]MBD1909774.1 M56 family metallopeptidase [Leptolyngbya sp. FACHB-8]MBD2157673.1 M56 family metallopeptidase [Leptolyngbya sp. FACHB-16]
MHLSIMLIAVAIAGLTRLCWFRSPGTWANRWQRTLGAFLLPPLLLLTTSMIVLGMGHHGTMLQYPVGWMGCHIALGFFVIAGVSLAFLFGQQWQAIQQVRSLQSTIILGRTGRVLEIHNLFAAQVGLWKSELVVSRGLLQSLSENQIEAVMSHEEAHWYYHDTFFFFWLNWIRQFTFWLPKTELLWQELLLLRELRADGWAAQRVDPLTLAETLLFVVRATSTPHYHCAAFYDTTPVTRLEERIDFLLSQSEINQSQCQLWVWLLPIALPILTVPLHG